MVGTLSADQATYRDQVAALTGLDRRLVTAWIGCESGWGVTKPDHNYLNIGPGRRYPDVGSAASDVNATLHNGLYDAVLAAGDPAAQIAALKASPWDAGHYAGGCLDSVYAQLTGDVGAGAQITPVDGAAPAGATRAASLLNPGDLVGTALGFISDSFDLDAIFGQVLVVVVSAVFIASSFGIIVLGLNRLTANQQWRQRLDNAAGSAAQVAALAAV